MAERSISGLAASAAALQAPRWSGGGRAPQPGGGAGSAVPAASPPWPPLLPPQPAHEWPGLFACSSAPRALACPASCQWTAELFKTRRAVGSAARVPGAAGGASGPRLRRARSPLGGAAAPGTAARLGGGPACGGVGGTGHRPCPAAPQPARRTRPPLVLPRWVTLGLRTPGAGE